MHHNYKISRFVCFASGVGGERSLMNEALAFFGGVSSFALQMVAQPTDGVFATVEARLHAFYCKSAGETQRCPSDCIPFTYIGFQLVTAFCFAICGCLIARVIWGSKKFRAWMLALLFVWTCGYLYTALKRRMKCITFFFFRMQMKFLIYNRHHHKN